MDFFGQNPAKGSKRGFAFAEQGEFFVDWQIVERHGLWWAFRDEHPPDEAFKTHGRPTTSANERAAEAAAIAQFNLDDEQRKRLVVRERD